MQFMPLGERSAERFRDFPVFPNVRALYFPMACSNIVSTIIQVATPFTLLKTGLSNGNVMLLKTAFHGNAFFDIKMTVFSSFRQ